MQLSVSDTGAGMDSATMEQMLKSLGYHVITENTSTGAYDTFEKSPEKFNLVITDLTMPDMTGVDLAEKMMSIRPDIPEILCTGYSDRLTQQTAMKTGIKKYS